MEYLYKLECYEIIGCCMEVHKQLGKGFSEIVYKDALEIELNESNVPYIREVEFKILYKDTLLPHYYLADFVLYDKIILEAKAVEAVNTSHIKQTMNYLAASKLQVALLINFGQDSLFYKRVVLTKNTN